MDFEIQTICVVRPAYFSAVFLLLLASTVACGISIAIACTRRMRGRAMAPKHLKAFHIAVAMVWLAYIVVVVIGWAGARRALHEYEQSTGKVAPAVRAAMNEETRSAALVGGVCLGVGLLSMVAWRGMSRTGGDETFT
jgi:hypothetical protein